MQLATNSSAPTLSDWPYNGIIKFVSSRAFVWYAVLFVMFSRNSLSVYFISFSHARMKTATAYQRILALQMRGWCNLVHNQIFL